MSRLLAPPDILLRRQVLRWGPAHFYLVTSVRPLCLTTKASVNLCFQPQLTKRAPTLGPGGSTGSVGKVSENLTSVKTPPAKTAILQKITTGNRNLLHNAVVTRQDLQRIYVKGSTEVEADERLTAEAFGCSLGTDGEIIVAG